MSRDLESLGERIAEQAAHLDAALHRLLADLREFDRGGGWHAQGARSCAHWLSWRVGWSPGTAREHLRIAHRLAELPLLDDALRRGEVSYSKIRAITRVATPENEAALLEIARLSPAHALETVCRTYRAVLLHDAEVDPDHDRSRRWVARRDTADGMVRIEAVLHPDEAALVWAALEHRAKQQCRESQRVSTETLRATSGLSGVSAETSSPTSDAPADGAAAEGTPPARGRGAFDRADALVALAQSYLRGDRPDRAPVEVVVSVPAATLRRRLTGAADPVVIANDACCAVTSLTGSGGPAGRTATTCTAATGETEPDPCDVACFADGTCISAEAARRSSCDGGVVVVIEDEHGAPLSVGRKRRTVPVSMKRALLQRDRTCRFPGCSNRLYLEAHHIEHWADGGETSLQNMLSCCSFHHRYLHEYGYSVELHADGPHFLDRRGRRVLDAPARPVPDDLGWEAILASHAELSITASTNEPLWDGCAIDYGAVIDALEGLRGGFRGDLGGSRNDDVER